MKKLSFCITCKNRLYQLAETLGKNLADNIKLQNIIEFILVDFDSSDGLQDWLKVRFNRELTTGYLKYFFTKELPEWNCSIAKNTSHILATGKIVVNLDCDNFTGVNGGLFVLKQFQFHGSRLLLHQASCFPGDGSFGRIALLKKYFLTIGGYDEAFQPMGYQDSDLLRRLSAFGLNYISKDDECFNKSIPNSKKESIKYTGSKKSYWEMCQENLLLSEYNIRARNIIANKGIIGIKENIFEFKNGSLIQIKM